MLLYDRLGCQIVEETPTSCTMRTPVCDEMLQPFGVLHGGVSAYLAETCASQGAIANLAGTGAVPAGLNLESTHLLPVFAGDTIETRAHLLRAGGRTQVWTVEQTRLSDGEVFNVSQLTVYVKRPKAATAEPPATAEASATPEASTGAETGATAEASATTGGTQ